MTNQDMVNGKDEISSTGHLITSNGDKIVLQEKNIAKESYHHHHTHSGAFHPYDHTHPSVQCCNSGISNRQKRSQQGFGYIEEDEEEDVISDDYDTSFGGPAEARHFDSVCQAFANYAIDSVREVARMESHFRSLSDDDKSFLMESIDGRIDRIKNAIINNQNFLNLILIDQGQLPDDGNLQEEECQKQQIEKDVIDPQREEIKTATPSSTKETDQEGRTNESLQQEQKEGSQIFWNSQIGHQNDRPVPTAIRNVSKVRSTLRQFVRDWSDEGIAEREVAYKPLLDALERELPLKAFTTQHGRVPRILCPGSGLGRLPFEVVRKGYACQGNEFSYFMLLGSNLILNCNIPPKSCVIQPYCLSTSNRVGHFDHLQEIRIPDICPVDVVESGQDFSMCAGEFVEVYWDQEKQWDAILTCFFIDTAKNILQYIRTIARILQPGGLWANIGPLLYHFSDMPNEISIELSWEEVKKVIEKYFTIKSIEWKDAHYTTNSSSMMQVLYHCVHFVAIRNGVEVVGVSNAVY